MTHLVMFDIDGTLVDSTRIDSQLYARAVRETLGGDIYIDAASSTRSSRSIASPSRLTTFVPRSNAVSSSSCGTA
jgi:beta-phosphoglucomutase-like phosphatase (HAD superfamily)